MTTLDWRHNNNDNYYYILIFTSLFAPSRLKELREEPYTQAEAERAAGMGSYIAPKVGPKVQTQPVEEDMD